MSCGLLSTSCIGMLPARRAKSRRRSFGVSCTARRATPSSMRSARLTEACAARSGPANRVNTCRAAQARTSTDRRRTMADYSIWVVEYARVNEFARGLLLYGQWNTGTTIAPYCYAVLKSDDHLAVIDSGYNHAEFGKVLADSYGVSDWQPPEVVLGHLGFSPDDVDTLVLTHNHFDHAGGVEFFPNARVYFQEREISKYMWA